MSKELQELIDQKIDIKYHFNDEHLFIIDAWINSEEREKILVRCIKKLREFNIPILLSTQGQIRDEIKSIVDYFLYDDNNEVLTFDKYQGFDIGSRWVRTNTYTIDNFSPYHHDYAFLSLAKKGILFAKMLGKKKIHMLDYDCIIDTLQYSQTFLNDINNFDAVFGFIFSFKIELAEKIFVNDVALTIEEHFHKENWRCEQFIVDEIKKYSNNYKISDYIDNDKTFNIEAAWNRGDIDRNGAFFEIYPCVNNDDLYIGLVSNNNNSFDTPTSGKILANRKPKQNYLLEIKYNIFSKFHDLALGSYDLLLIGKYIKNEKIIIKYMGIKVFEELLTLDLNDYQKIKYLIFV